MGVVVVAFDRRFLDRPVHALDLAVGPGVVHFSQPVVDLMFTADAVEDVFECKCILLAIGELDAVVRQDRVDLVGHSRDKIAQELSGHHLARPLMQFDIGELGGAVDGHEEADFSLASAHFGDVDMEIPDGVTLELLLRLVTLNLWKAADPVPLQTAMQRRSR